MSAHAQQDLGGVVDVDLRFDLDAGRERVQRGVQRRFHGRAVAALEREPARRGVGASSALEGWSAESTRSFAFARPASMCATARAACPSAESTKPTATVSIGVRT